MNDKIPYTDEMLATIFRRPLNTVRLAINTFERFGMIEVINNVITIPNWDKHQTLDALEKRRERQKLYMRERREKQKLLVDGECKANSKANCKTNVSSLEEEGEEDIDIDIEEDIDNTTKVVSSNKLQPIVDKWNSLNLNKLVSINNGTNRYKLTNARIKEYGLETVLEAIDNIRNSSFLRGQNKKGWTIKYDWFIKPNNFIKVLENNYIDGEEVNGGTKQDSSGNKKQEYDFSKYEG